MHGALSDALEQLKRGNERFTAITLREQEFAAALAGLRQDFSRAMLTADEAKKAIGQIRSEIAIFRSQLRMIAFIVGPAVGIIVVIISEFIKRLIWP